MKKISILFLLFLIISPVKAQWEIKNLSLGLGYRQAEISYDLLEPTIKDIDGVYHQGLIIQTIVGLNIMHDWLLEVGFNLNPGKINLDTYSEDNKYKQLSSGGTFTQFFLSGLYKFKNGAAGLVFEHSRFDKRILFEEIKLRIQQNSWRPGLRVKLDINKWLEVSVTACNRSLNIGNIREYSISFTSGVNIYNLLN